MDQAPGHGPGSPGCRSAIGGRCWCAIEGQPGVPILSFQKLLEKYGTERGFILTIVPPDF
jgi:hypothetical protein